VGPAQAAGPATGLIDINTANKQTLGPAPKPGLIAFSRAFGNVALPWGKDMIEAEFVAQAPADPPASTFHVPLGHKPPSKSALFLQAMLLALAGVMVFAAYTNVAIVEFFKSVAAGEYVSQADVFDDLEPVEEMAAGVPSAVNGQWTLCAIAYLIFVYCAAENLERARATGYKRSPNGVLFFSMIPLANIYLIYLFLHEIWASSRNPHHGKEEPPSQLVLGWILLLAGIIGDRMTSNWLNESLLADDLERATGAAWFSVAAAAASVVASILLVFVIRDIVRAQRQWPSLYAAPT
jgi:hypothetical protein